MADASGTPCLGRTRVMTGLYRAVQALVFVLRCLVVAATAYLLADHFIPPRPAYIQIFAVMAICAAAALIWKRWNSGISVAFLALSAFNIGQWLAGYKDCDCFPFALHPLITAMLDALLALLYYKQPVHRHIYAALLCILAFSATLGWAGVFRNDRAQPEISRKLSGYLMPKVGRDLGILNIWPDNIVILATRSDCPSCSPKVPKIREELKSKWAGDVKCVVVEMDLGNRTASVLVGDDDVGERCADQIINAIRYMSVPSVLYVEKSVIRDISER